MKIAPVTKGATNQHHRYAYASAETMIDAARIALNTSGLACTRKYTIQLGEICFLSSTFQLDHTSGESRSYENLLWPIIEGNGRPFDKALAGALTTQLAYFLRDLLLIPKEDENEIDKRNDDTIRKAPAKSQPPAQTNLLGLAGAGALKRTLKQSDLMVEKLSAYLAQTFDTIPPADIMNWPSTWTETIRAWIALENKKEESQAKA